MIVGMTLLYFALTCTLILRKLNAHKKVSYRLIQTGTVYFRLQVSSRHRINNSFAMQLTLKLLVCSARKQPH